MRYFGLILFIILMIICWRKRCLKKYWLSLAVGMVTGCAIDIVGVGLMGLWNYPRQPYLSLPYFGFVVTGWGIFGALINMTWNWLNIKKLYSFLILTVVFFAIYELPNIISNSWVYNAPTWVIIAGWFPLVVISRLSYLMASEKINIKKIADVSMATTCFVLLLPLYLIILVMIGKSPLLFQKRYGSNESTFQLIKFRTMHIAEAQNGVQDIRSEDKRITRVGRILRKTNLDEIPQLLNVIKGDMSIIGPRPIPVSLAVSGIRNWRKRSLVKPGIFGLAQIYCTKYTTLRNKFRFDAIYVGKWSLLLDFKLSIKAFWDMRIRPALALAVWIIFLLTLMFIPISEKSIGSFTQLDKIAHTLLFLVLVLFAVRFANDIWADLGHSSFFAISLGLLLATSTEALQSFMPLRNMSYLDMLADVIGISIGIVIAIYLKGMFYAERQIVKAD